MPLTRSTQKFPTVEPLRRAMPRIRAAITPIPARGGGEVLHRQAGGLSEVAHRRLTAIRLPVGIGHEADRCVERRVGRDSRSGGRVEREGSLESLHGVEGEKGDQGVREHRVGICSPALFAGGIDPADPIDPRLEWPEHPVPAGAAVAIDAGHVAAQGDGSQQHRQDQYGQLEPARRWSSELLREQHRRHQEAGEQHPEDQAYDIVHVGFAPSSSSAAGSSRPTMRSRLRT